MKNLLLLRSVEHLLPVTIHWSCLDSSSRTLFGFTEELNLYQLHVEDGTQRLVKKLTEVGTWSPDNDLVENGDALVKVDYVIEMESLVCFMKSGTVLVVNVHAKKSEVVGVMSGGLLAAAWSPDQEIVTVVLQTSLMLMSKDFTTLVEIPFTAETENVEVTWRGDGQYFAVSVGSSFLVYSRDGVYSCTSQTMEGLYHCCWKPQGNLLAVAQKSATGNSMLFFERNGLLYSSFPLPKIVSDLGMSVYSLSYSADSELLSITCRNSLETLVLVYMHSNAHHYLCFSQLYNEAVCFSFDPERFDHGYFLFSSGLICWTQWFKEFTSSSNPRTAFVIDCVYPEASHMGHTFLDGNSVEYSYVGPAVRLTDMRTVIPPPMSGVILEMSNFVNEIAIGINNSFVARTMNGKLIFYGDSEFYQSPTFQGEIDIRKFLSESLLSRHLQWISKSLISLVVSRSNSCDVLLLLHLDNYNLSKTEEIQLPFRSFRTHVFESVLYIQTSNGNVYKLVDGKLLLWKTFTAPCPRFTIINLSGESYLIGLDNSAKLYLDNQLVSPHATSMCIPCHQDFLIFTTPDTLVCLPNKFIQEHVGKGALHLNHASMERSIERNGVIVSVLPDIDRVVLFQPRGNLESVYPRMLSLNSIHTQLISSPPNFRAAFNIIRTHRLDMNLLFDHSPTLWFKWVSHFVSELKEEDYLNLFISSLSEDNCILTKFPVYQSEEKSMCFFIASFNMIEIVENKINSVCSALRSVFISSDKSYALSILTSFVKQVPADLESSLRFVQKMRNGVHFAYFKFYSDGEELAFESLKYLIFLVDIQLLYNTSLALYDFELAGMVAQQSQMDPKEYIPYLESLKSKPQYRAKFEIDASLNKWESAIKHLASNGESSFDELYAIVSDKKMVVQALSLYPAKLFPHCHSKLMMLHAEQLLEGKDFVTAGYAFRACNELSRAVECFVLAGEWKLVIILSGQLGFDESDIQVKVMETAQILITEHRYEDAAKLFIEFERDIDEGVSLYCKAFCWLDALKAAYQYGRNDLVECGILNAMTVIANKKRSEFLTRRERLKYCLDRLVIVRKIKAEKAQMEYDEEKMYDDSTSLVSGMSTSSLLSRYTLSSQISDYDSSAPEIRKAMKDQKKLKRIENKMAKKKIKEGHPLEEEFLVKQIASSLAPSKQLQDSMLNLADAFLLVNHAPMAAILQKDYDDYTSFYQDNVKQYSLELNYVSPQSAAVSHVISNLEFLKFEHVSFDPDFHVISEDFSSGSSKFVEDDDSNIFE